MHQLSGTQHPHNEAFSAGTRLLETGKCTIRSQGGRRSRPPTGGCPGLAQANNATNADFQLILDAERCHLNDFSIP